MKNYQEFLVQEGESMTIENLANICKDIVRKVVETVSVPLGLTQQAIVLMDKPFPHIHCQREIFEDNLDENNKFIADECCKTFEVLAEGFGLTVNTVKDGDEHGRPGDVLAKAEIVQQ
jgi:hypothetical protein